MNRESVTDGIVSQRLTRRCRLTVSRVLLILVQELANLGPFAVCVKPPSVCVPNTALEATFIQCYDHGV